MKILQEYTALIYGVKNCRDVNDARYQIFMKLYSFKRDNEKFKKNIRGFDSTLIPPCLVSLEQKIRRTIYVTAMWKQATLPVCASLKVEECGWVFNEDRLYPFWFKGDPTPLEVDDILIEKAQYEEEQEEGDKCESDDE